MGTEVILMVSFIISLNLYGLTGLYLSFKHGAKIPGWSIIKKKDYTLYLHSISFPALLVNAIISLFVKGEYIFLLALPGVILMFLSVYINFLSKRDLARYWTPFATTRKEQKLVKSGIYAKVRHPIYLSLLFLISGVALVGGNIYSRLVA